MKQFLLVSNSHDILGKLNLAPRPWLCYFVFLIFVFAIDFRFSWLWLTLDEDTLLQMFLNTITYFQLSTWATIFPHEELSICCFLEWLEPSGQHRDHLLNLTHTWQHLFWCNPTGILPGFERLNVFFYASAHLFSFCYNKYATLFWHIYMVLCLNSKIVEMGNFCYNVPSISCTLSRTLINVK